MNPLHATFPWTRWVLALSLLFNAGFLTAFTVQWVCHRPGEDRMAAGEPCRLYSHLHLSPEQQARADRERRRLLADVGRLQQRLAVEREALMALLLSPDPDPPAIQGQLARISEAQTAVQQRVIDHYLAERRQLPPEQRQAFQSVIRTWVCPRVGGGLAGEACGIGCGDCALPETTAPPTHSAKKPISDTTQ
jgi:hypothetical protein